MTTKKKKAKIQPKKAPVEEGPLGPGVPQVQYNILVQAAAMEAHRSMRALFGALADTPTGWLLLGRAVNLLYADHHFAALKAKPQAPA